MPRSWDILFSIMTVIIGLVVVAIIVIAFLSVSDPGRNRDRDPVDREPNCDFNPDACLPDPDRGIP